MLLICNIPTSFPQSPFTLLDNKCMRFVSDLVIVPFAFAASLSRDGQINADTKLRNGLCRALTGSDSAQCIDDICHTKKRSWLFRTSSVKTDLACDSGYTGFLNSAYERVVAVRPTNRGQLPKDKDSCRWTLWELPDTLDEFFELRKKKRGFWSTKPKCSPVTLANIFGSVGNLKALTRAVMLIPGFGHHIDLRRQSSAAAAPSEYRTVPGNAELLQKALSKAMKENDVALATELVFALEYSLNKSANIGLVANEPNAVYEEAQLVVTVGSSAVFAQLPNHEMYEIHSDLNPITPDDIADIVMGAAVYGIDGESWPMDYDRWNCEWTRDRRVKISRPESGHDLPIIRVPWRVVPSHENTPYQRCATQVFAAMQSHFDAISNEYQFSELPRSTRKHPLRGRCWGLFRAARKGFGHLLRQGEVERIKRCLPRELAALVQQEGLAKQFRGILLLSHGIPSLFRGLVEHSDNDPVNKAYMARPSLNGERRCGSRCRAIENVMWVYIRVNGDMCGSIPELIDTIEGFIEVRITTQGDDDEGPDTLTADYALTLAWLLAHCARGPQPGAGAAN